MKWWEATAHLKRTPLLWSLGFKTPRIKLPSCSRARLDRPSEAPVSRSCQNSLVAPCRSSHSWDDKFCRDKIPSGYQKLRLNPLNGGSNRKIICIYIYVCIYIMHVCVYICIYCHVWLPEGNFQEFDLLGLPNPWIRNSSSDSPLFSYLHTFHQQKTFLTDSPREYDPWESRCNNGDTNHDSTCSIATWSISIWVWT